jgi:hypothetical protein
LLHATGGQARYQDKIKSADANIAHAICLAQFQLYVLAIASRHVCGNILLIAAHSPLMAQYLLGIRARSSRIGRGRI